MDARGAWWLAGSDGVMLFTRNRVDVDLRIVRFSRVGRIWCLQAFNRVLACGVGDEVHLLSLHRLDGPEWWMV